MILERQDIETHLKSIRSRGRPVSIMLHGGRIERYDAGSNPQQSAEGAGAEWIGTYDKTATVEMVADDLEAAGVRVQL